jgi:hypothetical protein
MNSAREFLKKDEKLLAQLLPEGSRSIDVDELPLRIVDTYQGRVRQFLCSPRMGVAVTEKDNLSASQVEADTTAASADRSLTQITWEAFGDNFLAVPLRIEPNWECEDAGQCVSCDPKRLVEVFHKEPHSSIASGHPCLLHVEDICALDVDKASDSLQEKLQVSDADMAKWQVRELRSDRRSPKPCLAIERLIPSHRTRSRAESPMRSARGQKPLTIRGAG